MSFEAFLKRFDVASDQRGAPHSKIADLRRLMAGIERRTSQNGLKDDKVQGPLLCPSLPAWRLGVSDIDQALPEGGLCRGGVHEFLGASYGDHAAASGYVLALIKKLSEISRADVFAPVLWCQTTNAAHEFGSLYGAGLNAFGFDPELFLFVGAAKNNDVLWALEEGARASNLLAVVGDVHSVSFTQTRRLTLAAMASGTPVLLLRSHQDVVASAAETRWRVRAVPGNRDPFFSSAPGDPHWHVELMRCRGGRTGSWTVEWNNETYCFGLAEQFSSRSSEMGQSAEAYPKWRSACG